MEGENSKEKLDVQDVGREIRFVVFYFSFYHLHTDRIPFASIPAADGTGSDACACVHRRVRDLIMELAMLAGRHSITCGNSEMPHLADRKLLIPASVISCSLYQTASSRSSKLNSIDLILLG